MWDPGQYLRYAGERGRPFFDLLARVGADEPGYVADLGCGPGNLTAALADRWPGAEIVGVDNSPEMIAAAREEAGKRDRLSFALGDIRDWRPGRRVDVLRVQRRAAVGARPSGRGPALAGPARPGRVAGLPASRQLRPADPRDPARPGPVGPVGAAAGAASR